MNSLKIYHLHVPKTGGQYIKTVLLEPLCKDFNIEKNDAWHYFWEPAEKSNYVISSFREPIKRLVSEFVYISFYVYTNKEINVLNFLKWSEENKGISSNYQSKSFLYDGKETGVFNKKFNYIFENINIDKELLYSRLNKINVLLKTNQLNSENLKTLRLEIIKFFDLQEIQNPSKPERIYNATLSRELYKKLSPSEIQYLESLNKIDLDIYYSNGLFWNEGK
jgi:hypothetical protein